MVYKELLDAMLLSALAEEGSKEPLTSEYEAATNDAAHDPMLPTSHPLAFLELFELLSLDPLAPFTESFLVQSRPVITGNALRFSTEQARCLDDMVKVWARYVEALGLGEPGGGDTSAKKAKSPTKEVDGNGRTENRLELVYRRAGPKKSAKREKRARQRRQVITPDPVSGAASTGESQAEGAGDDGTAESLVEAEAPVQGTADDVDLQAAIAASLADLSPEPTPRAMTDEAQDTAGPSTPKKRTNTGVTDIDQSDDKEDDELALAIEWSLAGNDVTEPEPAVIALPLSQGARTPAKTGSGAGEAEKAAGSDTDAGHTSRSDASSRTPSPDRGTASGGIIGRHRFQHDPVLLQNHLRSVLQYWTGEREPVGVAVHQANRCGWCEFEEGCEWR